MRIPSPAARLRAFPHQLSGGMRQRVVGAMAIAAPPRLLIADEPTTSLDLTIQAQYLGLLKELQQQHRLAMIFVTHNLGIVAQDLRPRRRDVRGPHRRDRPGAADLPRSRPTRIRARSSSRSRASAPSVDRLTAIEGQPPDLAKLPPGCAFAPRCPAVMERCRVEEPPAFALRRRPLTRCWLHAPAA